MAPRYPSLLWFAAAAAMASGLLVVPATASEATPEQPNSPSVNKVDWFPAPPQRGYDIIVRVILANGTEPDAIELLVCRIQRYECKAPLPVEGDAERHYAAVIKWDSKFVADDVNDVGLRLTVRFADGRNETSPLAPWPAKPPDAPADAPPFYAFRYVAPDPQAPPAPGSTPGVGLVGVAVAVLAALRRRP